MKEIGTLGEKIAIARLTKRWTQKRLAAAIGVTQSMLSQFENGHIDPRWYQIVDIAEKLGIPVLQLLPLDEDGYVVADDTAAVGLSTRLTDEPGGGFYK